MTFNLSSGVELLLKDEIEKTFPHWQIYPTIHSTISSLLIKQAQCHLPQMIRFPTHTYSGTADCYPCVHSVESNVSFTVECTELENDHSLSPIKFGYQIWHEIEMRCENVSIPDKESLEHITELSQTETKAIYVTIYRTAALVFTEWHVQNIYARQHF